MSDHWLVFLSLFVLIFLLLQAGHRVAPLSASAPTSAITAFFVAFGLLTLAAVAEF